MTAATRTRLSLGVVTEAARDLRRNGYGDSAAWRGVVRLLRRYAQDLRWIQQCPARHRVHT